MNTILRPIFILTLIFAVATAAFADDKDKERKKVRKMAQETLQRLYKADPVAKTAVEKSAGYAVFSSMGVKILFADNRQNTIFDVYHPLLCPKKCRTRPPHHHANVC